MSSFLTPPPQGDVDPHLRVGADAGVVPADPGPAEGAGRRRPGVQQHRRHAGRDIPRMQDRVLKKRERVGKVVKEERIKEIISPLSARTTTGLSHVPLRVNPLLAPEGPSCGEVLHDSFFSDP